jgi:hypothetical protein
MCTNLACCSFERDHEGQPAAFFPVARLIAATRPIRDFPLRGSTRLIPVC